MIDQVDSEPALGHVVGSSIQKFKEAIIIKYSH